MMNIITEIFGEGKELNAVQIGSRTFVMYIIAVILIRIAGLKTFGKSSSFDNIIIIMLGAILSRGVVGASPFFAVVISGLVMVLMTRLVSWLSIQNKDFAILIKGQHKSLYQQGRIDKKNLSESLLSEDDLLEGVRLQGNTNSLDDVEEAFLECSGDISVIKKKAK
ncbi:YetF domain-containing protein [Segetibacter sp.]|jgi:uncharacterized membrane protein YcaP (DUF421 family)|uniref:DUF421 domain-containing protein n=1 Tax=Segetibacter sp. TaxID=2231182 RepID=UPI002619FB4B|nr:YetF domain-containing protein [Segetibacter sp.]MCW3080601.1 hypothetical protein [Segetibacter sp.]